MKMYTRFALGLRGFLHHTISLKEAKAIVRQRIAERENNFLRLVKRGIFGYPKSPYLPLLKLAGCEMGDIENMVRDKGLEGTLMALREAGVYVTFEEFKGREPIVRNGKVIHIKDTDFDNPFLRHYYQSESGGSTGAGTRVSTDLDHLAAQSPNMMLTHDAHGILGIPTAVWFGILPDSGGINTILRCVHFGQVPEKWFSPVLARNFKPSPRNRLATHGIINMNRLLGVPIPQPEPIGPEQAMIIAQWAATKIKKYGACLIITLVSNALRICLAAKEEGIDLTGAVLWGGGEPPTPAKVREITGVGARWIPGYWITEMGPIGMGCSQPIDVNDLHLFKDILVIIPHPSRETQGIYSVFYFTTLLPTAPKMLLNVESDDCGIIETRSCGCPLESYGFTQHLRSIHSPRKLTGEGVTLVGSDMIYILEELLPSRFGGSPSDYQLVEEEEDSGFTRVRLFISPQVTICDEKEVVEFFLSALKKGSVAADMAQAIWRETKTLQIKRADPILTGRGKLMPLFTEKHPKRPDL
jgi:hypothetical protein